MALQVQFRVEHVPGDPPGVVGVWPCLTVNACCHAVPPWHEGSESNVVPAAQPDLQAILSEIRGLIAASVPERHGATLDESINEFRKKRI